MSQRLYVCSEKDEICLGHIVDSNYLERQCINFLMEFVCGQNDSGSKIWDNVSTILGWWWNGYGALDYKMDKMTFKAFIETYYRDFPDRRNEVEDYVNKFIEKNETFELNYC